MGRLRIRQTDDLELVSELDRACFGSTATALKGDEFDHSIWWIAELDGKPVAYAGLHPEPVGGKPMLCLPEVDPGPPTYDKAFLCRAGVLKEARGQGIQRKLISVRVACAKRLGIPRVYTYVSTANVASMKQLVRCGFEPYSYTRSEEIACIYLQRKLEGAKK